MKTIGSFIDRPNGACLAGGRAPAPRVRLREGGPSSHSSIVRTGPVWQEGGHPHTLGFAGGNGGERPHP